MSIMLSFGNNQKLSLIFCSELVRVNGLEVSVLPAVDALFFDIFTYPTIKAIKIMGKITSRTMA